MAIRGSFSHGEGPAIRTPEDQATPVGHAACSWRGEEESDGAKEEHANDREDAAKGPRGLVRLSRPFSAPLALWVPLATCVALGVPGVIALITHHVILFASLAPTSVMITQQPMLASTKPYNTIVGHMVGLGAGFFAVWVLGIASQPSIFAAHMVSGPRVCAAVLSIAIAMEAELLLKARHPPAASTTLLAALGSFRPDWTYTWEVLAGVIAVTAAGEILRIFHPAPRPPDSRPSPAPLRLSALRHLRWRASADS